MRKEAAVARLVHRREAQVHGGDVDLPAATAHRSLNRKAQVKVGGVKSGRREPSQGTTRLELLMILQHGDQKFYFFPPFGQETFTNREAPSGLAAGIT